ncbi:MAG: DUF1614 domain-containing protein [Thermodesulfobacteriota bacterium]
MDRPPSPPAGGLRARGPAALLLGVLLAALIALIELGVLEFTYERLGIGHRLFGGLLLLSLVGSVVNVPVTAVGAPPQQTILAVNLGGAVVPTLLALYLLLEHRLLLQGAIAVGVVATVSFLLARPVPGVGIAVPVLLPPVAAAVTALALAPDAAPALAYAAGSLGTLVGADLGHLGRIRDLRSPMVSIGGAGTFDGIFLTGIFAVLLA